ncbi:hypothetical protein KCP75_20360 [Salmonella enterica subsp. enterica]|nr:hypothetical protein KCP75_20360 [Salmonella enterica subsp. enterica]
MGDGSDKRYADRAERYARAALTAVSELRDAQQKWIPSVDRRDGTGQQNTPAGATDKILRLGYDRMARHSRYRSARTWIANTRLYRHHLGDSVWPHDRRTGHLLLRKSRSCR